MQVEALTRVDRIRKEEELLQKSIVLRKVELAELQGAIGAIAASSEHARTLLKELREKHSAELVAHEDTKESLRLEILDLQDTLTRLQEAIATKTKHHDRAKNDAVSAENYKRQLNNDIDAIRAERDRTVTKLNDTKQKLLEARNDYENLVSVASAKLMDIRNASQKMTEEMDVREQELHEQESNLATRERDVQIRASRVRKHYKEVFNKDIEI